MDQNIFIYVLIGCAVGVVIGATIMFIIGSLKKDSIREKMKETISSYEREMEVLRKNGLSVVAYPYKEEHGVDGIFSDERRAEIGYKYQVFVAGVPCLEAHKVVTDVFYKKQVNQERIDMALNQSFLLIESFASKHPAFVALKAAPSVAKMT